MHFAHHWRRGTVPAALLVVFASAAFASAARAQQSAPRGATKQLEPADLKAWRSIRQSVLSNDGAWFAYVVAPNEGDATLIVRSTADGKELKFPIGEIPSAAGGRGGAAGGDGASSSLTISGDSKWVAYTIYPAASSARGAGRGAGRGGARQGAPTPATPATPAQNKVGLVNLATGEKKEFDKIRRFAFNGDKPTWIAMQSYPEAPAIGTDLILYGLASAEAVNVGNVAEFGFDDAGDWLAYTIDARDQIGNGVQLRNMRTDVVRAIDSDHALYRHLVWADSGRGIAVLRGRADSTAHDTLYSVVAFTSLSAPTPKKTVFDPAQHSDFSSAMKVAVDRAPKFSDDLSAIFFGIRDAKKGTDRTIAGRGSSVIQAGAPGMGGTINQPRVSDAQEENPSLILWHGKDPRLQSQQIVQEAQDRAFNYLSEYRLGDNKFVRLSDDALRAVNLVGHDHFAYGIDTREYDQPSSYNGRRYEDIYGVDLATGQRKLLLEKHIASQLFPSPNGKSILFWGDDAQWWIVDVVSGQKREITKGVPTVFADTSDDHNNLVTPPVAPIGWSKDGNAVLLSDAFDVWKVPANGAAAVNLTVDGKKSQVRYQRLYAFERAGR
ncbi:MAG TPA: hypothetical protein VKP00_14980, partial [Gemmatimonadaceae bacterium]|nr:hypothetical protein [Gemmatimonadaceae bacterium]